MRILVLSNLYPPAFIGGYELGCHDVVERLVRRGHDIQVLTSSYPTGVERLDRTGAVIVARTLLSEWTRPSRRLPTYIRHAFAQEAHNRAAFHAILEEFRPDVLYVWNPANISLSLVFEAEQKGIPVAYFISDEWPRDWKRFQSWLAIWTRRPRRTLILPVRPWLRRLARDRGLRTYEEFAPGRLRLDLSLAQFASEYLARVVPLYVDSAGSGGTIAHWGVDTDRFTPGDRGRSETTLQLLYVGQVIRHKGLHTMLEAVRLVLDEHGARDVRLDIVGGGPRRHVQEIHARARALRLDDAVRFRGAVPRDQLPSIYRAADILLFPSEWNEPFSITLVEAMASGLAIVGTTTGGSGEILQHEYNALAFPAGDAEACAAQLNRVVSDPALRETLANNARQTALDRFRIESMVDSIEAALRRAVPDA